MTDLGTLVQGEGYNPSMANAINDLGQVVGISGGDPGDGWAWRAFVWANGTMSSLGPSTYTASDINNSGQVAGWGYGETGQEGFVWEDGQLTSLGSGSVGGINTEGDVAGTIIGAVVWSTALSLR